MKQIIIILTLVLGSTTAIAAGYYDVDEELKSASNLIVEKQYKQAIEKLTDAIKSDSDNADAWNLLGYASRKKGDALEYQGELFLLLGDKQAAEGNLAKLMLLCPEGCEQLAELKEAIAAQE